MEVLLLTEQQKDLLIGNLYTNDSYFNPIQDENNNWIISLQERDFCTNDEFSWVTELSVIEYRPKPYPPI